MGNKMMRERISEILEQYVRKNDPLILAVSGGVDSIVLLHLLSELEYKNITVAHLNHSLRSDADSDALFVKELALALKFSYREKKVDIALIAKEEKKSIETAGRDIRYKFFEELREELGTKHILVAHHADDLLESRIMHLIRGSGLKGLEGMKIYDPKRCLLRPMLVVKKHEIMQFAQEQKLSWKEDSTNQDLSFARNRVRHEILPACYALNPLADEAFERLALQAGELSNFLLQTLEERMGKLTENTFSRKAFLSLPAVLAKEFITFHIRSRDPSFILTYAHVEDICRQLSDLKSGHSMNFTPQCVCCRDFDEYSFVLPKEKNLKENIQEYSSLPEKFEFGRYMCRKGSGPLILLKKSLEGGIILRYPVPGDRVLLVRGERVFHKTLKKYFIENKIPVELRHDTPVLVSKTSGEVLALLGHPSLVTGSTLSSISLICEYT